MRTEKELLKILSENLDLLTGGLCSLAHHLYNLDIIDRDESRKLSNFIRENAPWRTKIFLIGPPYWYPRGWVWPRRLWINAMIRKIEREELKAMLDAIDAAADELWPKKK